MKLQDTGPRGNVQKGARRRRLDSASGAITPVPRPDCAARLFEAEQLLREALDPPVFAPYEYHATKGLWLFLFKQRIADFLRRRP